MGTASPVHHQHCIFTVSHHLPQFALREEAKEAVIEDWAWLSWPIDDVDTRLAQTRLANVGNWRSTFQYIRAASPNFFSVTLDGFLDVGAAHRTITSDNRDLAVELYTVDGSSAPFVGSSSHPFVSRISRGTRAKTENRGEGKRWKRDRRER